MVKKEDIFKIVIDLLIKIQELSGRNVPKIKRNTIPVGELPGFDSLNGLELVFMLPDGVDWSGDNLCVSENGKRALNVQEIVERLLDYNNS
jgi:hypothetical protein